MFYHLRKNQVLCEHCTHVSSYKLSLNTVNTLINLFLLLTSHVRRELLLRNAYVRTYVATDTHFNFAFKNAFHFRTLAIKLFNSATKLFKMELLPQHYEPIFF